MRKFTVDLNKSSIDTLQKYITWYDKKIQEKTIELSKRLLEVGIKSANSTKKSSLIGLKKEVNPTKYGCTAIMIGYDISKIIRRWVVMQGEEGETIKTAEVSPLLMAEFGSGQLAENPQNIEGYGQGTFPDQTHAFDVEGWSWKTEDGEWHHSKGVEPTMPMYFAFLDMYAQVEKIGKEVFSR